MSDTPSRPAAEQARLLQDPVDTHETGLVWDLPVRLAHWGLVLSLAGSWLTAELGVEYRDYHFWCGYAALGIVLFRLMWGVIGTHYAQFRHFLPGPGRLLWFVRSRGGTNDTARDSLGAGHNPLGALSIVVLLGLVSVQIGTGLFTDDDILYTGPYQSAVSSATVEWLTNLHHSNFDYLLAMVVLHLVAIAYYRFARRQLLTRAMITGRKPLTAFGSQEPLADDAQTRIWWRGLLVLIVAAALVTALLYFAPEPVYDDYYY